MTADLWAAYDAAREATDAALAEVLAKAYREVVGARR